MISDEYAHLAFRKAILQHLQETLRKHLTTAGMEPTELVAEDLPANVWQVPQHEVSSVVEEFEQDIQKLDAEMGEFVMVRRKPAAPLPPVEEEEQDEFNQ